MRKISGWLLSALLLSAILAPALAPTVSASGDMDTGGDAPNTVGSAATISAGSGTGSLSGVSGDNVDFYKIPATYGQYMTVTVTASPSSGVYVSTLFRSEYSSVSDSDFWFYSISSSSNQSADDVGYFYVAVSCASYVDSITYTLNITVANSENQTDMCVDSNGNPHPSNDAADSLASYLNAPSSAGATSGIIYLNENGTDTGYLGGYHDTSDDYDFYKIYLNGSQTFTAGITPLTWTSAWPHYTTLPSTANYDLYLLDENSNVLTSSTNPAGQDDNITYTSTTVGYRYIKVARVSGHGTYTMSRSFADYGWAAFSGTPTDSGLDTNSDGLYENLVVTVNLSVATAANYALLCQLYDNANVYQAIAIKALSLNTGSQAVELKFNGPTLHSLHANGPYHIVIGLYSAGSLAAGEYTSSQTVGGSYDSTTYTTGTYSYTDFASASGTATTVPPASTTSENTQPVTVTVGNLSAHAGGAVTVGDNGVTSIAVSQDAQTVTVTLDNTRPVKTVTVTTDAAVQTITVQVEKLEVTEKPAEVTEPTTAVPGVVVSHYLEITATPTAATAVEVQSATIEFKVTKSWITANNIDSTTVKLMRYSGGWTTLQTSPTGTEDSTYKYYTATTPGFSTFAVTGKAAAAAPSGTAAPSDSTMLIIAGAVILIVVIAAAVFATKFRKP